MSDNRTFMEKAQDIVENVRDKFVSSDDSKQCLTRECNQRAEQLYGGRLDRVRDVTCGGTTEMHGPNEGFLKQGMFPQPGVLCDRLEETDGPTEQFCATEEGHEGQLYEKIN